MEKVFNQHRIQSIRIYRWIGRWKHRPFFQTFLIPNLTQVATLHLLSFSNLLTEVYFATHIILFIYFRTKQLPTLSFDMTTNFHVSKSNIYQRRLRSAYKKYIELPIVRCTHSTDIRWWWCWWQTTSIEPRVELEWVVHCSLVCSLK